MALGEVIWPSYSVYNWQNHSQHDCGESRIFEHNSILFSCCNNRWVKLLNKLRAFRLQIQLVSARVKYCFVSNLIRYQYFSNAANIVIWSFIYCYRRASKLYITLCLKKAHGILFLANSAYKGTVFLSIYNNAVLHSMFLNWRRC